MYNIPIICRPVVHTDLYMEAKYMWNYLFLHFDLLAEITFDT